MSLNNVLNGLLADVEDTTQRRKLEDYGVMMGSIAAAEAVPGLGEVQIGFQFLDFIDPFGYNQALNRKGVDEILTNQYTAIENMQSNIKTCYTNVLASLPPPSGNPSTTPPTAPSILPVECTTAGITPADVTTFLGYSDNVRQKLIKSSSSWATPTDPIIKFPDALRCTIATSPEWIKKCTNEQYKGLYMDYWNANAPEFEKDAAAAEQAAIDKQAKAFSGGDDEDDNKNVKLGVAAVVFFFIVFFALRAL